MTMTDGIDDCTACHRICIQTAVHCLGEGGRHAERDHVRLLWDCADVCRMTADLMSRGSFFHAQACALCQDICTACAENCETFEGDSQMQRCAEACHRCAKSCGEMSRR